MTRWTTDAAAMAAVVVLALSLLAGLTRGSDALTMQPIVNQGPCATSFERTHPSFCRRTSGFGLSTLIGTGDLACTAVTLSPAVPSAAKAAVVLFWTRAKSANVASTPRWAELDTFSDSSCLNKVGFVTSEGQEFTATVAGTVVAGSTAEVKLPVTNGQIFVVQDTDAGLQGQSRYLVVGYYD